MKIIMFLMLWDTERSGRGTGGEAEAKQTEEYEKGRWGAALQASCNFLPVSLAVRFFMLTLGSLFGRTI